MGRLGRDKLLVLIVLLVAVLLRVWGIGWGLPDLFEEATPMRKAWNMWGWGPGTGVDLNPHFFNYPALTFYLNFVGLGALYVVMLVLGVVASTVDYQILYLFDKTPFALMSRGLSLIMGVLTVAAVIVIGRRIAGGLVGVVAGVLLAMNVFHIDQSQLIAVDLPLTMFATLALVLVVLLIDKPEPGLYLAAGVTIGLATSCKYTGAILVVPLIVSHFVAAKSRVSAKTRSKLALASLAAAGGCFLLTSPYVLIDFSSFWTDLTHERQHMALGHFGAAGDASVWFYARALATRLLGLPLFVAALAGIVLALIERKRWVWPLAAYVIVSLFVVSTWSMRVDRYILPVIPLLCVFGAWAMMRATSRLPRRFNKVALAVLTLLVITPHVFAFAKLLDRTKPGSNSLAREWIEKNVPEGSLIALEHGGPGVFSAADFWQLDKTVRDRIREIEDRPRLYCVVYIPLSSVTPETTAPFYDPALYEFADYIVTNRTVEARYRAEPERFRKHVAFYDTLTERFDHVVDFETEGKSAPEVSIFVNPRHAAAFGSRDSVETPPDLGVQPGEAMGAGRFYLNLGLNYETYGHVSQAEQSYRYGLRYGAATPQAFVDLATGAARCMARAGRNDEARAFLERTANGAPDARSRANLLEQSKRYGAR